MTRPLRKAILLLALAACDGSDVPADAGGADAAVSLDARLPDAGAIDADGSSGEWTLELGPAIAVSTVVVDGSRDSYLAGTLTGSADVGGTHLESAGGEDGVLLAFDPTGALRWARVLGGPSDDALTDVTSESGAVYVTGFVTGVVDLGGGPIGVGTGRQVLAMGLDAEGTHRWSRVYGAGVGTGIATNATGNVDVAGVLEGAADFGGGPVEPRGAREGFVASFDAMGAHRWSAPVGGGGDDRLAAIANDLSCNVYVIGDASAAVDLAGACAAAGSFVASWDQWGAFRWARCLPDGARVEAITVDGTGHVALAGSLAGTGDFGGPEGAVASTGGLDALIVGLDRDGATMRAATWGDAGDDAALAVALDPVSRPYVAGTHAPYGGFVALWDEREPVLRALEPSPDPVALAIEPEGWLLLATVHALARLTP